jgi:glutathionyl-hydroquinone reductase
LTTPEEAQAFLAAMRDKQHQREVTHRAASSTGATTTDGLDTWFYQSQKLRDKELRQRRLEAEALLRGYRGGRESLGGVSSSHYPRDSLGSPGRYRSTIDDDREDSTEPATTAKDDNVPPSLRTVTASTTSESLDDPRSFASLQKKALNGSNHDTTTESLRDAASDKDKVQLRQNLRRDFDSSDYLDTAKSPKLVDGDTYVAPTIWLDFIEPGGKFPPEPNRYHLYLSYACPGSHRALIVRALKGLDAIVTVTYVHPTWRLTNPDDSSDKHRGWVFGNPHGEPFTNTIQRGGPFPPAYTDTEPDPLFQAYSIREIYERAGDTSGKYTVPLLWDKVQNTIVNNESSDIAYMLNSCFNDFSPNPHLDLYTEYDEEGLAKLNEVSDWLTPLMIHGVYRCGFAKNQRAYDKAIAELCDAFDRADDVLQKQRYLTGNDTLTDADIRLFVSLIRFDEVYAIYFKANARLVMLTPSLLNFCREIYQIPGIAETCQMDQIKAHFFGSHAEWNKYSVIPRGLGFMELLDMPHDRHLLTDDDNYNHHEGDDDDYNNDDHNQNEYIAQGTSQEEI